MPGENKNQLYRIGTRRAKDLANRLIRNETPGPFHVHFPKSLQSALDNGDGRHLFFDGLFAERRILEKKVEKWERIAKMNTGEPWDCFAGNIAVLELAMLTYAQVSREIGDMSIQPPRERHEGEDKSVMADILARRMVAGFDGTTSQSLIPSLGVVNLPDWVAPSSASVDDKPSADDGAAPTERRGGLKVRAFVGVPDTPRSEQPAAREEGMRINRSGMTIRKRSLV